MITADTDNAPDWVDLTTPDIEGAKRFYSQLLGWELERTPTPMGDYYIGKQHGHEVAGLMAQGPELSGTPPVWTMFVNVADVEETVTKTEEAGGRVLEQPFDIPDGRVAMIADPTGAMLGVISTPLMHSDEKWFSQEPGAVCWVELLTRHPDTALHFYEAVFGWTAETSDMGETSYTIFKLGDDDVAGMMMMPAEVPEEAPAHWATYFTVDDCVAAENKAIELGGHVLRSTAEIEMGRFAVLADPQAASFQIMEYNR